MTLLILVLVNLTSMGKAHYLINDYLSIIRPLQSLSYDILNCLLSPALFLLTGDQTMLLPPLPSHCPKILFAACSSCFYMQTLVRAIRDLTTEWLKARKYWPRQSENRFTPAVMLWPDTARVASAAFKTDWKPNAFTCFGVPTPNSEPSQHSHKNWLVWPEGRSCCCFSC